MNKANVVDWIVFAVKAIAWPALVTFAWKASASVTKAQLAMQHANDYVVKMATNDIPHIEKYLENMSESLAGMREDFKEYREEIRNALYKPR